MGTTATDLARARRRRIFFLWLSLSLVVAGTIVGFFFYKPWRLDNLNRSARAALDRGDYTEASLKARRALQLDPNYAPACVAMAEIAEHDRQPDAFTWRERVLHLSGESGDSLLAFASCALSFGKKASAKAALERVPEAYRTREDYLVVAGTIALDAGDNAEAARFYEKAKAMNPENAAYRLALGKAQSASDDYLTREAGRRLLADLAPHPTLGVVALRTLIASYEEHEEVQAALRATQQLVALPSHEFSDEVLRLRFLMNTGDEAFGPSLAAIQQKAESNPNHAGALLLWMSRAGLALEALEWALKRAPKVGQTAEVRPALAGCYLTLGDWPALLASTQSGAWKPVEYVRHAYRARAFREQGENAFARNEWTLANNAGARQSDALIWLAQMASEWKWADETEQSLWALLEQAPGNRWAIETLSNRYFEKSDTAGLRRVAVHLVKMDPADENAQNDLAISSLLLSTETDRATRIAKELYTKHPENAAYASTFAYALHCAGRTAEGLKVLESLPPNRLEEPAIAAYYGVMLVANHSPEKARRFLQIGRDARLLLEERALLTKAERQLPESNPETPKNL